MSKSPASYAHTRYNAMKWGVAVDGPLPCRGEDACPFRHCRLELFPPPQLGDPCPYEQRYAAEIADSFRRRNAHLRGVTSIDVDRLAEEAGSLALRRVRLSIREDTAWESAAGRPLTREVVRDLDLAFRYYTTALNRESEIRKTIGRAEEELAERIERSRRIRRGLEPSPFGS